MKKLLTSFLVGALLLGTAMTTVQASEPVTIKWSINETANLTREQWTVIKDAFEESHPDIKIEFDFFGAGGESDYASKIAAGTLADVIHMAAPISMIEGVLAEIPEELYSKWDDAYLFKANGVINTVPVCGQGQMCVIYKKDIFETYDLKEPQTYQEFLDICDTLVSNGVTPMQGFGASNAALFVNWWVLWNLGNYVQVNYDNFNQDLASGAAKWTDEGIIERIKEFQSWNSNGYYSEGTASIDYGSAEAEFLENDVAMSIDGVWYLTGLDPDKFGMFFTPCPCDSNYMSEYMSYWGVNNESEHKEEAFEFIDWALTGDGLQYYTDQILSKDAQISLVSSAPSYEMEPLVKEFYDGYNGERQAYCSFLEAAGDNALPTGFRDYLYTEISKIFFENADVETTMQDVQEEYEVFLSEQN